MESVPGFFAHTPGKGSGWHDLVFHLEQTAARARNNAAKFGAVGTGTRSRSRPGRAVAPGLRVGRGLKQLGREHPDLRRRGPDHGLRPTFGPGEDWDM